MASSGRVVDSGFVIGAKGQQQPHGRSMTLRSADGECGSPVLTTRIDMHATALDGLCQLRDAARTSSGHQCGDGSLLGRGKSARSRSVPRTYYTGGSGGACGESDHGLCFLLL